MEGRKEGAAHSWKNSVRFRPGAGTKSGGVSGTLAAKINSKPVLFFWAEKPNLVQTLHMKKLTVLLLPFFFFAASAQKATDALLTKRLNEYFTFTKNLELDKAMDYMHPKLFAIAPKDQLIATMKAAFNQPEMKFSFDSMAVRAISPVFKAGTETYRKVDYYMSMSITLSDSLDLESPELAAAMESSFATGFPGKKISIDTETNSINVKGTELLFAIKDPKATQWMFLGYDRNNPQLIKLLFPKAVRQHFKLLP